MFATFNTKIISKPTIFGNLKEINTTWLSNVLKKVYLVGGHYANETLIRR